MRKEEGVEGRLEDWLGCWEEWEEEEGVRGAWKGRPREGRGGERVGRRSEDTLLRRKNRTALVLDFSCATINYGLK